MTISSMLKFIEEFFRVIWLSVSSTKFYPDLYKKYKGYGIKYGAMVITITTLIYVVFLTSTISTIRHYLLLTGDDNNPIEYIIKQWPEVKYDGKEISILDEEPIQINNIHGKPIIGIDPENKFNQKKRESISILLQKTQVIFNFERSNDPTVKPKDIAFSYNQILGKEPLMLDQITLKELLINIFQSSSMILVFVILPIVIIVRLGLYILSNIFSIILLFFILRWMKLEPTIKSASRLILFAFGAAEILSCILLIAAPRALPLATLLEYWAIILAVYSLAKMNKNI